MTNDVVVPEYRTVVGQYSDIYGRPFLIREPKLQFINQYRLRNGIDELEKLSNGSEFIYIQDDELIQKIREDLKVNVHAFSFSPISVSRIISIIRSRLSDWLYEIQPMQTETVIEGEEKSNADLISRQSKQVQIIIGRGTTISGDFVVADSIANSFDKAQSASVADELKDLLKGLAKAVGNITEALPKETAEQAARDLEMLTAEVTSQAPREKWWRLSMEGLKKAAQDIGEIGKPILELVALIVPILEKR